ncbi:hypothetical protein GW916_07990 [bacterium]|nr:hypothetical protein [bacterium]
MTTATKRFVPNFLVQLLVLGAILASYQVFANSEFDSETGELIAPELVLVREDVDGNRTVLSVEEVPETLETDADKIALIERTEEAGVVINPEDGAEGNKPSEFDRTTATPAWHRWYYPRSSYSYWYSYGYYSYYPAYSYNYSSYRYWYYYRW